MGVVMLLVATTLVTLGGDSSQLSQTIASRYASRNLAKSCAEKAVAYLRNQDKLAKIENYKARKLIEPEFDTMLSSANPVNNYGAADQMELHKGAIVRRVVEGGVGGSDQPTESVLLLKFNLTNSLPAGATILSANLKLYSHAVQTSTGNLSVYKIMPSNKGWVEGNKSGAIQATIGEPSWNYKDSGAQAVWSGQQGMSLAGVDFYAIPESTVSLPIASSTSYLWPISSSTVNAWLNDSTNAGLIIKSDTPYWAWFSTKEAINSFEHPVLDIIYSVDKLNTEAGGISQNNDYCFYEINNVGGNNWLIRSTSIIQDVWSFMQVKLTKPSLSSGAINVRSWQEVTGF